MSWNQQLVFEEAALNTIKAVIAALDAEVPFLFVHPDNKSDGMVLCHREVGQTIGARATDLAKVRDTGVFMRTPIVLGSESYLCDQRWDWMHIGPLVPATLTAPVMQTLRQMPPADWRYVPLAINAQQYQHVSNTRNITEERQLDEETKRIAISRYEERLHTQEANRRRDTAHVDKPGHFTTDKLRNALRANAKGVAIW